MLRPCTRRTFVRSSALGAVAAAAGFMLRSSLQSALAQAPIPRTGGPWLKTSLNAYSFSKPLNDAAKMRGAGMTLTQLLEFCAEQDFDAVDPTGYFFPGYPKVPSDKFLNDFKRRAHALGLEFSGTGVRNDLATPDGAARA